MVNQSTVIVLISNFFIIHIINHIRLFTIHLHGLTINNDSYFILRHDSPNNKANGSRHYNINLTKH